MRQHVLRMKFRYRGMRWEIGLVAIFASLLVAVLICQPLRAQDIAGTWQGSMQAGKEQRIVVKIAKDAAAAWQGTVYNLDANNAYEGRTTTQMSFQGAELRFAIAPIDASYNGKLSDDGTTIAGMWTQSSASYTLNLTRVTGDAVWEIPKADPLMAKDADPDWEVMTVRPRDPNDSGTNSSIRMKGRQFVIENKTVEMMLKFGYGVQEKQIVGAPHWIETEKWDVVGVPDVPGIPSLKQIQSLTRKALEERFGLKLHKEKRELAVYAITLTKSGAKVVKSVGDPSGAPDERDTRNGDQVKVNMTNASMTHLALLLTFFMDRPVVDQTGLDGRYDFQLKWTADDSRLTTDGNAPPGLFTAIQEQMGLKLEPVKAPTEVLMIDALVRPTVN